MNGGQQRGGYSVGQEQKGETSGADSCGGRGGNGGRGGSRAFTPNVRRNVRELCEETPPVKTSIVKRVKGVKGIPIQLITNHYLMNFEDMTCFHYDIEIKLKRNDGKGFITIAGPEEKKMRKEQQLQNIKVVEKLANQWTEVFGRKKYVFDGQKNIYTGEKLAIPEGQRIPKNVSIRLDGFSEQTFEVNIKFTNEVPMNTINDYFSGRLRNPSLDVFREAIQVLEIVLRYKPSQTRIPVGRNLFSSKEMTPVRGDNALIGFGHHQSVQMTEVGLTLNVDRSATLFRDNGSLIDFIAKELNVKNLTTTVFTKELVDKLNRKLSGLKIYTTHITNQKRRCFIDSLTILKPNECMFEIEKTDGSGKEMISVENYFLDKYKLRLRLKDIPCLLLKGGQQKRYLPVEVCHVYANQPMPKKLINANMTRSIVEASNQQKPIQRFGLNQESVEAISHESRDLLKDFGLKLNAKPIKLNGRVLEAPTLYGNDRKLNEGKELKEWCFFNVSQEVNKDWKNAFNKFFGELIKTGSQMGIKIAMINIEAKPSKAMSGPYKSMATISSAVKKAKELCPNLQMIFFCIPAVSEIYYAIKYFGDIEHGVITQCLNDDKFMNTPRGYFNNILLKINAKLNGKNQILSPHQRPDTFTGNKNSTMIVGVDVTHPGTNPLANEKVISSIAACVGSYDQEFSKFMASISVQPQNKEIILKFDLMIGELLQQFSKHNGKYPQSIIVFRDGVSEGQFSQVLEKEIPRISDACLKISNTYRPKITVFVVQKRHHTRFIPFLEANDDRGKPLHNIPAGTVVDHTITNPNTDEFHLCSHKGSLVRTYSSNIYSFICVNSNKKIVKFIVDFHYIYFQSLDKLFLLFI